MVKELEGIFPSYEEDPQDILYSEVEEAIRTLTCNNSPGSDSIRAEMIQAGGEQLAHEIHKLCNKAWHEGTIPEDWGKSILIPLPTKGDLSECTDSTVKRTQAASGPILVGRTSRIQTRQKYSTTNSNTQAACRKTKRQREKIYNCFIDFQKAFDTIKHKNHMGCSQVIRS